MTSDDRDELGRLLTTLEQAPGFRIERYTALIRTIGTIFLDNSVELEAALVSFRAPQAGALIVIDKRAELDRFLLLATRRLYNYLATACSTVEHTKAATRRLPDDLAPFRKDLMKSIEDFERTSVYLLNVRLRDYSIHRMLHLTGATATFSKTAPSIATDLTIHLDKVRAEPFGRRRKGPVPDPLRDLSDKVSLYPLFLESRDHTKAFVEQLLARADHEYQHHSDAIEKIRARVLEIRGPAPSRTPSS